MEKLLIIFLFFASFSQALADISTARPEEWEGQRLGTHLRIWHPEQDVADPHTVVRGEQDSQFQASVRPYPSVGFSASEFWARLEIEHPGSEAVSLWLENQYTMMDALSLYSMSPDGTIKVETQGDTVPRMDHEHSFRGQAFHLRVKPGTNVFYLRSKTEGSNILALSLWREGPFDRHKLKDMLTVGLLIGVLGTLILYNSFLAVSFRSMTYYLYTLFLVSMVLTQMALQGLWMFFDVPFGSYLMNKGFLICANVTNVMGVTTTIYFLNMKEQMPKLYRWAVLVAALPLLIIGIGQFSSYLVFGKVTTAFIGMGSIFLFGLSFLAIRSGYRPAWFFMAAWAFVLGANILTALHFEGVYHASWVVQFNNCPGAVCEGILMSLALAERVNDMRDKSAQLIRDQQQQNLELAQKNAEQQASLREETESKLALASDVAHRLNNPLNYIQIGLISIENGKHELEDVVRLLFADADPEDADIAHLRDFFKGYQNNLEVMLASMKLGLLRATDSIDEIRGISGIDGRSIQVIQPRHIFAELSRTLAVDLDAHDFQRLRFHVPKLEASQLQADPFIVQHALKSLLFELVRSVAGTVQLKWQEQASQITVDILFDDDIQRTETLMATIERIKQLLRSTFLEAEIDLEARSLTLTMQVQGELSSIPLLAS